jgi:mono/diheme cytochrome c family protein
MRCRRAVLLCPALAAGLAICLLIRPADDAELGAAPPPPAGKDPFVESVLPVFTQYCVTCHSDKKKSAGLSLEPYKDTASAKKARDVWDTVKELVENKQMPPKGKPQPTDAERKAIVAWIESAAIKVDCTQGRDPGRPTIRRLNKVEYDNTIRDLIGVDLKAADAFPADDVGYGFDNIGDVLSLPPILFEKYLTAAERTLDAAIVVPKPIKVHTEPVPPRNLRSSLGPLARQPKRVYLNKNGSATTNYDFAYEGEYVFRARAYGEQVGKDLPKLGIELDRKALKSFDVEAVEGKAKTYEVRTKVTAGKHDVSFTFTNAFTDKTAKDPKKADRTLSIEHVEIEGPFNPVRKPAPAAHQKIFVATPTGPADAEAAAKKVITTFADRAYRRPIKVDELARLMKLYQFAAGQNEPFEASVKHALKAVLVSPHFLFRIERDADPNNPEAVHPITPHELATRLSYFLWSTMPDDELSRQADSGELRKPAVLEAQVKRMLRDPKSSELAENFAGQWLMLRTLTMVQPDRQAFPKFDAPLRKSMIRETELYFDHVMREDRSVLEFLDSDYTFVNSVLAQHYGISGVTGTEFRKVALKDSARGGILTHGSILTVTSNPTRTSPVMRGKWVLENILGTPPPPPPPDVPELEADSKAQLTGSLRQRMEKHRNDPNCATCHAKMDPIGFGLENFDAVGAYRTEDGKFKIDASGVLPDGAKFTGPAELRKVLIAKGDLFRKNLAEKMLTYALGRGLEHYDKCSVDDVLANLKKGQDKFSALIMGVVTSEPFQKRRGSTPAK